MQVSLARRVSGSRSGCRFARGRGGPVSAEPSARQPPCIPWNAAATGNGEQRRANTKSAPHRSTSSFSVPLDALFFPPCALNLAHRHGHGHGQPSRDLLLKRGAFSRTCFPTSTDTHHQALALPPRHRERPKTSAFELVEHA